MAAETSDRGVIAGHVAHCLPTDGRAPGACGTLQVNNATQLGRTSCAVC
jgi:hypothetical protein